MALETLVITGSLDKKSWATFDNAQIISEHWNEKLVRDHQ